MPEPIEVAVGLIQQATRPEFRARLISRGQAREMIWRNGIISENSTEFSPRLTYDLNSYGFSLLSQGLRVLELEGPPDVAARAFEFAGNALEAAVVDGERGGDRGFHFVMAAASYHLARLSAASYSLLSKISDEENISDMEKGLSLLILRNFKYLDRLIFEVCAEGGGSDQSLERQFFEEFQSEDDIFGDDEYVGSNFFIEAIGRVIRADYFAGLSVFLLALERGDEGLARSASEKIRGLERASSELNIVPQWWVCRITAFLLREIWGASYHCNIPPVLNAPEAAEWSSLRENFLSVLMSRDRAEIDLWPSQIEGARRAADELDDLVVSLPTSAGKTRIAEICILRCLAGGRRVLFVTPLRALSAQTEVSLRKTFQPLGKSVSALYGSTGVSGFDEDALRSKDIVVSTPEKIDFALRSAPSLIDDVGLVIFDEGHMIGMGGRELKYEIQIQRLLRRPDASSRRIVCLSAILPDGDQLQDFANWIRSDSAGNVVKSDWRPTRLRFGEIVWNGRDARLDLNVGEEECFVARYISGVVPPVGRRKTPFPASLGELCLATAWRLIADGRSALIYCPVRSHVEPFAERILDLNSRGVLPTLLSADHGAIATALVLGEEWLGHGHPILRCLELGIAIHHGALPTAYRKEVEKLLRDGVLKLTISSPTLAQGLNLSASAVIFHSIHRNKATIPASEFKNVVGRAGRAYVDIEGLVLYPIFDKHAYRLSKWNELISESGGRSLESGLLQLVVSLLLRMHQCIGGDINSLTEYVINNARAWDFAAGLEEDEDEMELQRRYWNVNISNLDMALLGLIGDADLSVEAVSSFLDEVLESSLWQRRVSRLDQGNRMLLRECLASRARYIVNTTTLAQRRGYYLAGVDLSAGRTLDEFSERLNWLLVQANVCVSTYDFDGAVSAIIEFARIVFRIPPFNPDVIPETWEDILRNWLFGRSISSGGIVDSEILQFVESGLIYRLPWAMEAVRVRAEANGELIAGIGLPIDAFDLGGAVLAVETGSLDKSASILMQSGFSPRLAAIFAVSSTGAAFSNFRELAVWVSSDQVKALSAVADWPTPETHQLWIEYQEQVANGDAGSWAKRSFILSVNWYRAGARYQPGMPVKIVSVNGTTYVISQEGVVIGDIGQALRPTRIGFSKATIFQGGYDLLVEYFGPGDFLN